jgi:hypothetical protein
VIRVVLPYHLRTLAKVEGELRVEATTLAEALAAVEAAHPVLRGTIRDATSGRRRAFVRFFADRQDISHGSYDEPLPAAVLSGTEPLLVVGAMAGG